MKKQTLLLVLFTIALVQQIPAQTAPQPPLTTKSVSIFKNGQAFFLKTGTVKTLDGKWQWSENPPPALYGTLWFHSPDGTLTKVASFQDREKKNRQEPTADVIDLVRVNLGKYVYGVLTNDKEFEGTLESITPVYLTPERTGFTSESIVTVKYMTTTLPKNDPRNGSWFTIPAGQIKYLRFSEKPTLEIEREREKLRHVVELSFSGKKTEQPIDLLYLANGLTWAPQYLLELNSEKTATLTLQGEVANDLEDLDNTELNLVVGVPNFKYADRLAFLVDFLKVVLPDRRTAQSFSNALATQTINYTGDVDFDTGAFPSPDVAGSSNEDLFFYTLKNFSLPKYGRSMQTIFKEAVEIAHIYESTLPPNNPDVRFYDEQFLFTPDQNKVFHTIKTVNSTSQPWTTASVLVLNKQEGNRPVSQDLLTYTPAGGKNFIQLTEAPDVKVEQAERETSRQQNAWTNRRLNISYDLVQVEGKIKVQNFKDKKIDLRLTRTITGILKNSSVKWEKQETVSPKLQLNRLTNVCWETSAAAKGSLEITYTYEVYVPAF